MNKLLSLLLLCLPLVIGAQEEAMRVVHCTAIPQNIHVYNIFINQDNDKWAGTSNGLYKINSADNATKIPIDSDEWALLMYNCGNYPLILPYNHIVRIDSLNGHIELSDDNSISAAHYDLERQELWVGTTAAGVYRFAVQGERKATLIDHFNSENSKLKTNHINTIFIDRYKRQWIGTTNGVLYGDDEKWRLYEKGANIQAVTPIGVDVWIMSEDVLWKADNNNRWIPGDFDLRLIRGTIRDICFDRDARLWVASDVITRYDVVADKVQVFGSSDGFRSRRVTRIATDTDAALWVGTADRGLYLIEKETEMTVSCEVTQSLSCEGGQEDGALQVKIIGGLPPFQYQWSNRMYGASPKDLGAGLYTVTVTDSQGRRKVVSARIDDVDLQLAASMQREASSANLSDGAAIAFVEGGRPNYQYRWDNGETTATATTLKAGKHSLTVTDVNGCTATTEVEITHQPEPTLEDLKVLLTQSGENVCPGDQNARLSASVSGGQPPYQYTWSNGASSVQAEDLAVGTYSLTVSDALGHTATQAVDIKGTQVIQLTIEEDESASDPRARNGKASVQASGGSGNFTYIWDNGESGQQATKLISGTHSVTVMDDNNCRAVAEVTINEKQLPELDARTVSSGQVIQLKNLYFEADSANIEVVSIPVLDEVYKFLRSNDRIVVEVGGHTNNIPDHQYCDRLSTARAQSVAEYIISKGIASNRILYKGYGKRKPIASNRSAEGRRRNQRVEIKILSVDDEG